MFLNNKYTKWYYNIVNNAKSRSLTGYIEHHHIIPESFFINRKRPGNFGLLEGDPNICNNIVCLTAKEHFICHVLLTKMTEGIFKKKMCYALNAMCNLQNNNQYRYTSPMYEYARKKYSTEQRVAIQGEGNPMFNKVHSLETRKKMSKSHVGNAPWNLGKTLSDSHKKNISTSLTGENNPMFGKTQSLETRKKISESKMGKPSKIKGIPKSSLTKEKLSISLSGRSLSETHRQKLKEIPKIACEFCGRLASPSMHSRWHGMNCKLMH